MNLFTTIHVSTPFSFQLMEIFQQIVKLCYSHFPYSRHKSWSSIVTWSTFNSHSTEWISWLWQCQFRIINIEISFIHPFRGISLRLSLIHFTFYVIYYLSANLCQNRKFPHQLSPPSLIKIHKFIRKTIGAVLYIHFLSLVCKRSLLLSQKMCRSLIQINVHRKFENQINKRMPFSDYLID